MTRRIISLTIGLILSGGFLQSALAGSGEFVGELFGNWIKRFAVEIKAGGGAAFPESFAASLHAIPLSNIRMAAREIGDPLVSQFCFDLERFADVPNREAHLIMLTNRYGKWLGTEEVETLQSLFVSLSGEASTPSEPLLSMEGGFEEEDALRIADSSLLKWYDVVDPESLLPMKEDLLSEHPFGWPPVRALLSGVSSTAYALQSGILRELEKLNKTLDLGRAISVRMAMDHLYETVVVPNLSPIWRLNGSQNYLDQLIRYRRIEAALKAEKPFLLADRYVLLGEALRGREEFFRFMQALRREGRGAKKYLSPEIAYMGKLLQKFF
ncbi:MAG: hypothetical protein HY391_04335 [Deltaproteobacteria bacterium]|nr:hypothetical protein [Deltaproteobacteria bacterium]